MQGSYKLFRAKYVKPILASTSTSLSLSFKNITDDMGKARERQLEQADVGEGEEEDRLFRSDGRGNDKSKSKTSFKLRISAEEALDQLHKQVFITALKFIRSHATASKERDMGPTF